MFNKSLDFSLDWINPEREDCPLKKIWKLKVFDNRVYFISTKVLKFYTFHVIVNQKMQYVPFKATKTM